MTLPNFVIVGAGRSGTTSLYHYLNQHPDVFMSPLKETRFFAWRAERRRHTPDLESAFGHHFPIRELEQYETLFNDANDAPAKGEATPRYIFTPGVPEAMAEIIPDAKLVAILREPTARAFRHWLGYKTDGNETLTFEQAVEDEFPLLDRDVSLHETHYLRPGFYFKHLQRYLDYFPRNQMLILLYDDLSASPSAIMSQILSFLKVDENAPIDMSLRHNPTGIPKNSTIERLTGKNSVSQALKRHLPRRIRAPLYAAAMRLRAENRRQPEMSLQLRRRLLEAYREDTEALAAFLDRDLSAWQRLENH